MDFAINQTNWNRKGSFCILQHSSFVCLELCLSQDQAITLFPLQSFSLALKWAPSVLHVIDCSIDKCRPGNVSPQLSSCPGVVHSLSLGSLTSLVSLAASLQLAGPWGDLLLLNRNQVRQCISESLSSGCVSVSGQFICVWPVNLCICV